MGIVEEKVGGDVEASLHEITSKQKPESTSAPMEEAEVDYKAELEKAKTQLKKAEYSLYKRNKDNRELSKPTDSVRAEVAQVLREQKMAEVEDMFEEELDSLTSNEDERELIRLKYENSLLKTGITRAAIRQDLEDAKFLANKAKYLKEQTELARTAVSKRTMGTAGGNPSIEKSRASEDYSKQFTKGDWEFIQSQNFTTEQIKKLIANRK